jgi:hypothetical protein
MKRSALTILAATMVLFGCGRSSTAGVISSFGSHLSPDGRHTLKVERNGASLVVGSVADAGGTIRFSETIGSDAMRWCFYWSPDGSLWAYSSDTGYLRQITPQSDGTMAVRAISNGEELPTPVFEFLPKVLHGMYRSKNEAAPAS